MVCLLQQKERASPALLYLCTFSYALLFAIPRSFAQSPQDTAFSRFAVNYTLSYYIPASPNAPSEFGGAISVSTNDSSLFESNWDVIFSFNDSTTEMLEYFNPEQTAVQYYFSEKKKYYNITMKKPPTSATTERKNEFLFTGQTKSAISMDTPDILMNCLSPFQIFIGLSGTVPRRKLFLRAVSFPPETPNSKLPPFVASSSNPSAKPSQLDVKSNQTGEVAAESNKAVVLLIIGGVIFILAALFMFVGLPWLRRKKADKVAAAEKRPEMGKGEFGTINGHRGVYESPKSTIERSDSNSTNSFGADKDYFDESGQFKPISSSGSPFISQSIQPQTDFVKDILSSLQSPISSPKSPTFAGHAHENTNFSTAAQAHPAATEGREAQPSMITYASSFVSDGASHIAALEKELDQLLDKQHPQLIPPPLPTLSSQHSNQKLPHISEPRDIHTINTTKVTDSMYIPVRPAPIPPSAASSAADLSEEQKRQYSPPPLPLPPTPTSSYSPSSNSSRSPSPENVGYSSAQNAKPMLFNSQKTYTKAPPAGFPLHSSSADRNAKPPAMSFSDSISRHPDSSKTGITSPLNLEFQPRTEASLPVEGRVRTVEHLVPLRDTSASKSDEYSTERQSDTYDGGYSDRYTIYTQYTEFGSEKDDRYSQFTEFKEYRDLYGREYNDREFEKSLGREMK
ncbi:hypothetical protein BKA69DRAFT_1103585 [Paraphysoderma sedebokerense]|nr:hypothetical protein BKA69DRAFT_1103585 [Paraphysoderma sedebokerense]